MKFLQIVGVLLLATAINIRGVADDHNNGAAEKRRGDLYRCILNDDSWLFASARVSASANIERIPIVVARYPKDARSLRSNDAIWTKQITSLRYAPDLRNYLLLKVSDNRIFIFCVWSGESFKVDMRTGEILGKARGDAVLQEFDNFSLLKLSIIGPSVGRTTKMTKDEVMQLQKEEADAEVQELRKPKRGEAQ